MPCGTAFDWSNLVFLVVFLGIVIFSVHFPDSFSKKQEPENPENARRQKAYEALEQRLGQMLWKYRKQLDEDDLCRLSFRTLLAALLGTKWYCNSPGHGPEWFEREWEETIASWDKQATAIESCLVHMKAYDEGKKSS